MTNYTQHLNSNQREKDRSDQVKNNAGGYVFQLSELDQLKRFLILGSVGGTYYVNERNLTRDNAKVITRMVKAGNANVVVDTIREISVSRRAPSNTEAIFALALTLVSSEGDDKRYAADAITDVCRTHSHLFEFASMLKGLGKKPGNGAIIQRGFRSWYDKKDASELCYQMVKYQSRYGWSNADILHCVRPKADDDAEEALFAWATEAEGWESQIDEHQDDLQRLHAKLRADVSGSPRETEKLIRENNLTREMVRPEHLKSPLVWDALLVAGRGMPMWAMLRNLGKMTEVGVIKPLSNGERLIAEKFEDKELVQKSGLHPFQILQAMSTYSGGQGFRGSLTWSPSQRIVDALDTAFEHSFDNVESTGNSTLLGLDVSGSMDGATLRNSSISAREASAAMAMITARTEPNHAFIGFTGSGRSNGFMRRDSGVERLKISPKWRINEVVRSIIGLPFGRTDCALPMIWAKENKIDVDTFVIYTDNETYAGNIHPYRALKDYRQARGIAAKLIVVGMTSTGFSIADPEDAGMLDVVGFDSSAPKIIADFSKGGF